MVKILVIEDTRTVLTAITVYLKNEPAIAHLSPEVFAFADPIKAATAYPSIEPDVILLDYMLPNLNGFEFLDAVNWNVETGPPVAIITALYDSEVITIETAQRGIKTVLTKPLLFNEIVCFIKAAVGA